MPQKEKNLQFLGLGSVIDINHMEALLDTFYVIVARAVGKAKEGNTILRYQVAPHPQGGSAKQSDDIITLAESSITKVIHEGYRDEKDDMFLSEMIKGMENTIKNLESSTKTEKPVSQKKEPEKGDVLLTPKVEDEKEIMKKDPFYKFRK